MCERLGGSMGPVISVFCVDAYMTFVDVLDAKTKVAKVEDITDGWMGLGRLTVDAQRPRPASA